MVPLGGAMSSIVSIPAASAETRLDAGSLALLRLALPDDPEIAQRRSLLAMREIRRAVEEQEARRREEEEAARQSQTREWCTTWRKALELVRRRVGERAADRLFAHRERDERELMHGAERESLAVRAYLSAAPEVLDELHEAFDEFDDDGSGTLDAHEFQDLLFQCGEAVGKEEAARAFASVAGQHAGAAATFEAFAVWWLCAQHGSSAMGGMRMRLLRAKLQMRKGARRVSHSPLIAHTAMLTRVRARS